MTDHKLGAEQEKSCHSFVCIELKGTCFYILVRHLSGNSSPFFLPKMLPKVRQIDMKDSLGYVWFLAMFAF